MTDGKETQSKLKPESARWKKFRRAMIEDFQFGEICIKIHQGEPVKKLRKAHTFQEEIY